jgi:RimJ/RimL family protein N-acetyltransferase
LTDGTIVLDTLRGDDAAALIAMGDEALRRMLEAGDPTSPMSAEEPTNLIEGRAAAASEQRFAIRRGRALVGIGRIRSEAGGWIAVLEVVVAAPARRAGVGMRSLRLLADYSVDVLGASRLRIDTEAHNAAAHRLAEALGFKRLEHYPGRAPGWVHHGLTDDEWAQRSHELADDLGQGSIAA